MTCAGRPGSFGYEFQDARTYASWGVDYLKYDWCNNEGRNAPAAYKIMGDALKKSGRPLSYYQFANGGIANLGHGDMESGNFGGLPMI